MPDAPAPTRRARLRAELTDQIVAIGRRQLAEGGPSSVSWRGIAKEVGMNPASLYTYVDGIDDLFTRILIAAFGDLAGHLDAVAEQHAEATPRVRLTEVCRAYRAWAVEHPQQFNLIFTDQIPGYAAPAGGPTVDAELAVYRPMVEALSDTIGRPLDVLGLADLTLAERTALFAPMAALHGFVMLEINHHAPVLGDGDDMLVHFLETTLDRLAPRTKRRR